MLDRRTSSVLEIVNGYCCSGEYKVFSEEDFLSALPEKWGIGSETLGEMLHYLSENGYIAVKYSHGGMFCIRPLPLGRSYCEREAEKKEECAAQLKYFMATAFFGGFVGAILGAVIMAILSLVIG